MIAVLLLFLSLSACTSLLDIPLLREEQSRIHNRQEDQSNIVKRLESNRLSLEAILLRLEGEEAVLVLTQLIAVDEETTVQREISHKYTQQSDRLLNRIFVQIGLLERQHTLGLLEGNNNPEEPGYVVIEYPPSTRNIYPLDFSTAAERYTFLNEYAHFGGLPLGVPVHPIDMEVRMGGLLDDVGRIFPKKKFSKEGIPIDIIPYVTSALTRALGDARIIPIGMGYVQPINFVMGLLLYSLDFNEDCSLQLFYTFLHHRGGLDLYAGDSALVMSKPAQLKNRLLRATKNYEKIQGLVEASMISWYLSLFSQYDSLAIDTRVQIIEGVLLFGIDYIDSLVVFIVRQYEDVLVEEGFKGMEDLMRLNLFKDNKELQREMLNEASLSVLL
jgi:hypothetical protein